MYQGWMMGESSTTAAKEMPMRRTILRSPPTNMSTSTMMIALPWSRRRNCWAIWSPCRPRALPSCSTCCPRNPEGE